MENYSTEITINNVNGYHVRPSTLIASEALKFKCEISLYKIGVDEEEKINAKSSLDLISGFIIYRDRLKLVCIGEDASAALKRMKVLMESVFDYQDAHKVSL